MLNRRRSNTQRAVDELRHLIFSGQLEAGSCHLENALAERLDMSRTPVREACLQLAAQGLLAIRPRKGVRISSISITDMTEIYEVLTELECLAVRKLAQSGSTAKDIVTLTQSVQAMENAVQSGDRQVWSEQDDVFHSELVRLAGNAHMQEVLSNFYDRVRWVRNLTLKTRPLPIRSNQDHSAVCQAILEGNAEAAEQIHRSHRGYSSQLLMDLLNTYGYSED